MYDRLPFIPAGSRDECLEGWSRIGQAIRAHARSGTRIVIECYPGVLLEDLRRELTSVLPDAVVLETTSLFRTFGEIDRMLERWLGDDPVFGMMNSIEIEDFFDPAKLAAVRHRSPDPAAYTVILGPGASLVCPRPDFLVYADMARWEIQLRQRRNQIGNLGSNNLDERPSLKYKRAFFVDWRAADRLKARLLDRIDLLLDTNIAGHPKAIHGDVFRRSLAAIVTRPFRVVPFFDPGPWGGHWMERVCDLPASDAPNHAWCFDCVPEENSLFLGFGDIRLEIPSLNLVLAHPEALLGTDICSRFGAEFPIRFDFLDTMGGGNLSLQVHPLTSYIREHFGMDYTQDESYYMLDAGEDACVYLGLRDGTDSQAMLRDLERAQNGFEFPAEKYVNRFPACKHDHFLIPAGTIHCSGRNSMVLEISATPYIFTFKLWDWSRLGLDGRPRPIHLRHGAANIQWDRTTRWVAHSLINRVEPLAAGEGWREERTGLHDLEFIETRRHWFTAPVPHNTQGTVHVLNLVAGERAVIESPSGSFEPFFVNYAETFIVPAAVGAYTVRPVGSDMTREYGTIQANVRVQTPSR